MADTYRDKLRDPRWQQKRLKIFERDAWTCQACGDTQTELQVHHLMYEGNPWDAPDTMLKTLCAPCHKHVTETTLEAEQALIHALRDIGLHPEGFRALAQELNTHQRYLLHFATWDDRVVVPLLHMVFALLPENWLDVWPIITNAVAALPQEQLDELKPLMDPYRG